MFGSKKGLLIAIPADEHCGSSVGLMPPGRWRLEEGGDHHPSPQQNWLWEQWVKAWDRIKELRKGRKLVVVNAGDAIDGVHHETLELVTQNWNEQARIHIECMDWAQKHVGGFDELYYLRGTESHVKRAEEYIARDMGAVSKYDGNNDGAYVWKQLFLKPKIGERPIIDIAHHGAGVGRRAWTRGNAFRARMVSYYYELLDAGLDIPRYVVRAHQHKHTHRFVDDRRSGKMEGAITPAFQLKTNFGHRVANLELSDIGMTWIVVDEDRTWMDTWRAEIPSREPRIVEV